MLEELLIFSKLKKLFSRRFYIKFSHDRFKLIIKIFEKLEDDIFEKYEHWGVIVFVRKKLKGKHEEHCLCWECGNFYPDIPEKNCPIAKMLYVICVKYNVVTPVWECPVFRELKSCI